MKPEPSRRTLMAALAGLAAALAAPALASNAPTDRAIQLVVGFSAGGPADLVARTLSKALGGALGTSVVVENRPGADGGIAAAQVARAKPDGFTLLLAPSTHAINASLYRKLPFDSVRDFTAVTLVGESPNIVAVNAGLPVRSIPELVSHAKSANPPLNYASSSSITQFATELFNLSAGTRMTRIPYKGAGQAMPALLSGEVPVMVSSMMTLLPHVKSGRIRALAVTSSSRVKIAPEIPTVAESGLPGYSASTWYGLLAPAGTPRPVVERIDQALKKVLADATIVATLEAQGLVLEQQVRDPAAFQAYLQAEVNKWRPVVEATGVSLE
ncbi:tripartite tricarboxylate transporter substrate binding protein [Ramlibacter sp. MAHUQ-53]|uniref:tripartite tricarboxylate transporter substrate binding protein n=1 Tax=unclassified Ramlibacter TaxID=2617605 RepID=UPI0036459827